jgi:hypothetical protein
MGALGKDAAVVSLVACVFVILWFAPCWFSFRLSRCTLAIHNKVMAKRHCNQTSRRLNHYFRTDAVRESEPLYVEPILWPLHFNSTIDNSKHSERFTRERIEVAEATDKEPV